MRVVGARFSQRLQSLHCHSKSRRLNHPAYLFWNAGRAWGLSPVCGRPLLVALIISLSHFSPHPLHIDLLTGVPCQALTFSPFLQCLRTFGPLALYSLTPPSTSPSSLPPLDWSRQLSYLPGKDQKTQLRAVGPSRRKHLGMVTSQRRPRGRQRKMSQEPGRRHSKLTLTASHMAPRLWV